MDEPKVIVVDGDGHCVSLGFTFRQYIPRVGEIVMNGNKLQFEVLNVLHRKHDLKMQHVVEIHISEALE